MITLRTFIEQEQPRINAALAEAAAELPVSIMPIAQYAMGNGGKRLRPLLTVLVARLLGYADNDIYPLAAAMEMFHVATLLHDDVMDNAEMRRGSTATHKVFGVTETILAGDALLAKGNQIVAGFGDPRLTAATSDAIAQTANGEILEIANQGKNAPDLLIYNQIIAGKTAWMIRTSCNIGAVRANGTPEQVAGATDYGFNLGMAFQIVDDGTQGTIRITLKYNAGKEKVISGLRRVSKPGLRVYVGADELPRVLRGLGIAIVSTSKGVMTDKAARAAHVGGEVLAFVW